MLVGSSPQAAVHNTPDQARSQFSLWSVMAAPLLIGSNILNLSAWDYETYTNREVHLLISHKFAVSIIIARFWP
jgi:hypothetical protein